jgi:transcriptional regulator with XRE-family HTH domain
MKADRLSEFLKENRIKAGFTQAEVAQKLGYTTPQFISNWERGQSSPPIKILKRLAKLYSVGAQELYDVILEISIEELKSDLRQKFMGETRRAK